MFAKIDGHFPIKEEEQMTKAKRAKSKVSSRLTSGPGAEAAPALTTVATAPIERRQSAELPSQYRGPRKWLIPFLEARYTALRPRTEEPDDATIERVRAAAMAEIRKPFPTGEDTQPGAYRSRLQPGHDEQVFAKLSPNYWSEIKRQYRERKATSRRGRVLTTHVSFDGMIQPAPGIAGVTNWIPLGPSVVRHAQPTGRPAISGRATGVAIAPGGSKVYVATAEGGVWCSDNGGASWKSTMENFDVDPTVFAATSQACGAIALDEADPNRVYVGTGEGDTDDFFASRLVNFLPTYRGIGPIRTDDGGATWHQESADAGSPTLNGTASYALAVDPGNRENVVLATNIGLYRREPDGLGAYHWVRKRTGRHSSVVVARSGSTTTFIAAAWGDKVYSSNDGSTWTVLGTSFPAGMTRIGVAVQRNNPNVVYAMVADGTNAFGGLVRLDNLTGSWKTVSGAPSTVLGNQGDYDLAIDVSPTDVNTIFIAGQAVASNDGALYKGTVSPSGSAYNVTTVWVGSGVHPDDHFLKFAPADGNTVWICTDGGVFKTTNASGAATFNSCNTGLGTVSSEYLSLHPTEPAVMFVGLQDNGTARYTGEECWTSVNAGDGGYCVVNWANPFKVITYVDGNIFRATDGGQEYFPWLSASWTVITPGGAPWSLMDEPLVCAPYNPGSPADADVIAFGSGAKLFISSDFGSTWGFSTTITGVTGIYAMVFASASRLFVGTTNGRVYRFDKSGATWTSTRIDNAVGGALPLTGIVADLEPDPTDVTSQSIYIAFGGAGDYRHVWHFDGTQWQARSGTSGSATALLDVEHNALIVDPANTSTLYAGADIGVWKSTDGGANWNVLENGLPDAAVLDLQIHPPSRRLVAALQGRGVYEFKLDAPAAADVELYIRDTNLDVGLKPTVDWLNDPANWPLQQMVHWESPNIKVDVPTPLGYQTPSTNIDFYVFNDRLVDGASQVGTIDPATGTVINRVYVELHNRGAFPAASVQVMVLLADASVALPPLPAGYTANVQAGTPVSGSGWQTVGTKTVTNLAVGIPQVVEFNLPSTMLPPPASLPGHDHYCLLTILHSPSDMFTNTQTNVDALTVADRKVGQKNLHLVQFVGTPPPGSPGTWVNLSMFINELLHGAHLIIDGTAFTGEISLLSPKGTFNAKAMDKFKTDAVLSKKWIDRHTQELKQLQQLGRFGTIRIRQAMDALKAVSGEPAVHLGAGKSWDLGVPATTPGTTQTFFLQLGNPPNAKVGDTFRVRVALRDPKTGRNQSGSTYLVQVVKH
jgi:hypothetical protein